MAVTGDKIASVVLDFLEFGIMLYDRQRKSEQVRLVYGRLDFREAAPTREEDIELAQDHFERIGRPYPPPAGGLFIYVVIGYIIGDSGYDSFKIKHEWLLGYAFNTVHLGEYLKEEMKLVKYLQGFVGGVSPEILGRDMLTYAWRRASLDVNQERVEQNKAIFESGVIAPLRLLFENTNVARPAAVQSAKKDLIGVRYITDGGVLQGGAAAPPALMKVQIFSPVQ